MSVVKPIWLLVMMWIVPPVRVARERAEIERLGHHALAGERGVAVDRRRAAPPIASWCASRPRRWVCSARARPSTTGPTNSRWLGLGDRVTVIARPLRRQVRALGAVMVLHVAGAALGREQARLDVPAALELGEDASRTAGRRCAPAR